MKPDVQFAFSCVQGQGNGLQIQSQLNLVLGDRLRSLATGRIIGRGHIVVNYNYIRHRARCKIGPGSTSTRATAANPTFLMIFPVEILIARCALLIIEIVASDTVVTVDVL